MANLTESKRQEFLEEYPFELVKDNPYLLTEAIGWIKGTQSCIPSISEWANVQETYLKLRVLDLATRQV